MPSGPPWRQPEYDAMLAKHIFEESPTSKLTAASCERAMIFSPSGIPNRPWPSHQDLTELGFTGPKFLANPASKRSGGIFALPGLARTPPPNYTSIKAKGKRPIPSEAEEADESEEDIGLSSDCEVLSMAPSAKPRHTEVENHIIGDETSV
ncbi:hypothetical protein BC829DRAFT_442282 [Chytridium lagenaria]|nr:hypothetical protein BC829DRAFT_442282 [Chytridium lagenaria]